MTSSPLQIYNSKNGTETLLLVKDSVFVGFLKGGESFGFLVEAFQKDMCKSLLVKLGKDFNLKQYQCKIAGHSQIVNEVEKLLRAEGLSIANVVKKDSPFSLLFLASEGRIRVAQLGDAKPAVKVATPGYSSPTNTSQRPVKVLIVDDSKTIRQLLTKVLAKDQMVEVVGAVEDPREVLDFVKKHKPDVMTLDLHMPHLDGIEVLKQVLPVYPIPTVIVSSISMEEGPMVLQALEAGAVDYLQKPTLEGLPQMTEAILEKVKMAAGAKVKQATATNKPIKSFFNAGEFDAKSLVVIGSSTGGTEALRDILTRLPDKIPPVLIVQHIPPIFSKAFADRMNTLCRFTVKEAVEGDEVLLNHVYVAPGGTQMKMKKQGDRLKIVIDPNAEPVNRFKPSVDYMFSSALEYTNQFKMVSVMLTGMGNDGARSMKALRDKGVHTIGQNEASCVVYGMPKAAADMGAVIEVLPLDEIAEGIMRACSKAQRKSA